MPIDSEPPDLSNSPVVEAAAADAVVAQAAEPHHAGHARHTHCLNCGTALTGPYCSACGQHDLDFHQSFGHVVHEALENLFHFDAKLFRNILTLLFRPGRLSAEFNAGRRAAQMPPFRLYLFISVLFFFVSFLDTHDVFNSPPSAEAVTDRKPSAEPGKPGKQVLHLKVNDVEKPNALERFLMEKGHYAMAHQKEEEEAYLHGLPKMLLFCLPLMALYTRFLYRRSGQVYLQHLIIAVHYHTFVYLWWLVSSGWRELVGLQFPSLAGLLGFAAGVWMTLYPFIMLRRLFGQSWGLTIFKTLVLTAVYGLTIVLGLLVNAFIVFMTI